ncbi:MAG: carbohydrate ABC transporter permease [Anaerolineae bacterium]|jgi:multiple sugar transport system permease protein/raffinose/stachyose/melibiose transport system permease protein|nr:carbohydrate ABC transporter permease [Anaerolineae bacterium]
MMAAVNRKRLNRVVLIALQLLLLVIVLLPFFWMLSVSLKPTDEPFAIPARLWPESPTLANYVTAFQPEFRRYFLNSTIVSVATIVIAISVGLLAAYSFSRFRIPGFAVLLVAIILAQMFPVATIIIPIFKIVRDLDLLNTYFALITAYLTITLPVSIWMLMGFVGSIPRDLEEAAMIDGATRLQAFIRVVIPLARPGIIATAVWIIVVTWQEFIFALAFTQTRDMRTVSVGMSDFVGQYGIRYGELMASSVMISIPIIVVFFFLQRYFVAGLTAGATKG